MREGERGPRLGEARVETDRFRVCRGRLALGSRSGSRLVVRVTAQKRVVGVEVARRPLRERRAVAGAEREAELLGHRRRDVSLYLEHIHERCVDRLLPATRGNPDAIDLHQLRVNADAGLACGPGVAIPSHPADEQVAHP